MDPQIKVFYEKDLPLLNSAGIKRIYMNYNKSECLCAALYRGPLSKPMVYNRRAVTTWNVKNYEQFQRDLIDLNAHIYLIDICNNPSQEVLNAMQTFQLNKYRNLLVFIDGICVHRINIDPLDPAVIDYIID